MAFHIITKDYNMNNTICKAQSSQHEFQKQ